MKRKSFIEHVAWTGAGLAYTMSAGGVFEGSAVASAIAPINFVQISDSHIGFHGDANPDVAASLQSAVAAINALPRQPAFVVHTGDVTHVATPKQFAQAKDILSQLRAPLVTLPGEHDMLASDRRAFFETFPGPERAKMWYSWEQNGAHYLVLINVFDFEKMGLLGNDQLDWLTADLRPLKASTPIVVFTHAPLYALYPQWGWTTRDGSKALALLARFDHVTVLSGHIHQAVRHQEGTISFASAAATAYPQPAPGGAKNPGPLALPHAQLLHAIGYRNVELHDDGSAVIGDHSLG